MPKNSGDAGHSPVARVEFRIAAGVLSVIALIAAFNQVYLALHDWRFWCLVIVGFMFALQMGYVAATGRWYTR